ncbi:MAG: ATP-binding cassette domain-containing protein [Blastochloris sp.]|nr:ATP-binding cassette domain-containing protein [Blastochloris sp.]
MIAETLPLPATQTSTDSLPCEPHLTVRDLGLRRDTDRWLFRHMNWELPRHQFIALTGASGVGKSSLLRMLCGLENPSEGSVTYCCNEGCHHDPRQYQKKVGVIFQNLRLIGNSSLLNNVLCGRLARYQWWQTSFGFPSVEEEEALTLLEEFGLAHLSHKWSRKSLEVNNNAPPWPAHSSKNLKSCWQMNPSPSSTKN